MTSITELSLSNNIFSLGSLLGTTGSQELVQQINAACGGGSFFGGSSDPYREGFQHFMQQVIEPIRAVGIQLTNTVQQVLKPDVYRPIDSEKELSKGIPPCMQLGIIYYPPIRQMLEEERIDGFGIDPKTLQEDDPFEPVLKSDKAIIHSSTLGKDGSFTMTTYWASDAPELTQEQKWALEVTREFFGEFVTNDRTKVYDPTDYPSLHC